MQAIRLVIVVWVIVGLFGLAADVLLARFVALTRLGLLGRISVFGFLCISAEPG